jgi:hypothetical protein
VSPVQAVHVAFSIVQFSFVITKFRMRFDVFDKIVPKGYGKRSSITTERITN